VGRGLQGLLGLRVIEVLEGGVRKAPVGLPAGVTEFKLHRKQELANKLLSSSARHVMLYGGSRSGKTFLILRALVARALAKKSRHAALRYRFNHLKSSVIYDTLPKMMGLCFPGVADHCKLDKTDWFYQFYNGSEIWFGGLDDKERTEKILGQEYSTIFFNECSQIPWASRNMAMTRLAQNAGLRLKAFYDCNPPSVAHWTYKVFIDHLDPDNRTPIKDRDNYASMIINPEDNRENLQTDYFDELQSLPDRMRRRFLLGQFQNADENALWTYDLLDRQRLVEGEVPNLQRIVIAVDPSGCSGPEETRSDEISIVVVGLAVDGCAYVLEDLSGRLGPAAWGQTVVAAFDRHQADAVVAEANYGGAMVGEIIRSAQAGDRARRIPFREVRATRGKIVRAEPIAALYEQGKVKHAGYFEALEDQLCGMTLAGYVGNKSPDRADALVWAVSELFPAITARKESSGAPPVVMRGYSHLKPRRH
jgi:phage terminase large subunit-like protein